MNHRWKAWWLLGLLLAGCQPRNQLDWRISATSPAEFDLWRERHESRFSPALQSEFNHAIAFLASGAGIGASARTPALRDQQLCRRLDRKTVRQIVADSYHFERSFLLSRSILKADNIVRNVEVTERIAAQPTEQEHYENVQARQEFGIELIKERLALIDDRLKQLEAPTH